MSNIYYLQAADYVVFISMLIISVIIGIYCKFTGGKQKTTSEYLLADNSMNILPVAFSLMASFMSAITLLGVSSEVYFYGTQFMMINISYMIGTPIAAFVFLPVFYKLKITSVYEYLEMRFNRSIRVLASVIFLIQMIFYNSIVLYAPALALSAVTNISKWVSILTVGGVCTIYCTIGGIKAVLWTDVFQSLLMFAAMFIIIVKGTIDAGGIINVWEIAKSGSRIEFFNFSPDPTERHTTLALVIGACFIYTSIYGVNQTQIQRLMTVKSLRKSQKALFLSWPITSLISFSTALSGLVIYANFSKHDPLKCGYIKKPDQLLPYYTIQYLSEYPGIPGLVMAGIFSGSLSTVSSFVNSLSAVTLEDYLKPVFKGQKFSSKEILITKLLALFYGCLCVSLTYLVDKMAGLLQASLTLFGIIGGPLLMIFTAGICFRITNSTGAMTGFLVSLIFGLWVGFGNLLYGKRSQVLPLSTELCQLTESNETFLTPSNKPYEPSTFFLYNISYLWMAGMCWFLGLAVALSVSLLTNQTKPKIQNNINSQNESSIPLEKSNKLNSVVLTPLIQYRDQIF